MARRTRARLAVVVAALIAVCATLLGPAQPSYAASFVIINGAGSTWSYNAIHTWQRSVAQFGMQVNYNPDGSTSGRNLFKGWGVDWAASEIPYGLTDGGVFDAPPTRGYAYIPDTAGATTFMYNLTINGHRVTNLRLSGATIAAIFTGVITMWNDPMIAADNPGLTLPAVPVVPVVRTDNSGATEDFTQWMAATQRSYWNAYCQQVGRSPCTPTAAYPMLPGSGMVGQAGDTGVSGYVSQPQADGAIGYVEYSYAMETGFPVAKVLNAAGYYTAPTPGNVGVSLLNAQTNMDQSSPLYLTQDLSQVYTDPDPRTYELSSYSYMIIPTDLSQNMTTDKGYTLGAFGEYALCQGQQQVDALGYSALPINLVEAGFAQLQRIPGASLPATTSAFIASCNNPTFSSDGTNTLANTDPMPPACDQQGPTQCTTAGGTMTTTTSLTASPNPATAGEVVTLTATVAQMSGMTTPAGTVQFEVGGTAIGTPVPVNANGAAATTTTFAAAGPESLSAVFTPTDSTAFSTSTGTLTLPVNSAPPNSGVIPIAVSVPVTGAFTLTVDTADTVTLTVSGSSATAATTPVTVTDTRNTYPGWSVSGQDTNWTGSGTAAGATIPGDQLGWTPASTGTLPQGVTLGSAVTPTGPGLGSTPAVLASVHAGLNNGYGSTTLGANLTLAIPASQAAGPYSGGLNITADSTNP